MLEINIEINKRFDEIRKALGINQKEFAEKMNMSQGHISDVKNLRKSLTDDKIELLKFKFDVNMDWLRTGQGEMFLDQDLDNFFVVLGSKVGTLDDMDKKLIVEFLKLNKEEREAVKKFIRNSAK